jgi:acyl-CoA synthetase (AMP-forming)/AMP-acid ligase II
VKRPADHGVRHDHLHRDLDRGLRRRLLLARVPILFLGLNFVKTVVRRESVIEREVLRLGRSGDMIIRGGENVYPVEVENRLLEHARITDAV